MRACAWPACRHSLAAAVLFNAHTRFNALQGEYEADDDDEPRGYGGEGYGRKLEVRPLAASLSTCVSRCLVMSSVTVAASLSRASLPAPAMLH